VWRPPALAGAAAVGQPGAVVLAGAAVVKRADAADLASLPRPNSGGAGAVIISLLRSYEVFFLGVAQIKK
jgi:hypothetical protein